MNEAAQPSDSILVAFSEQSSRILTFFYLKLKMLALWRILVLNIISIFLDSSVIWCRDQVLQISFIKRPLNALNELIFTTSENFVF